MPVSPCDLLLVGLFPGVATAVARTRGYAELGRALMAWGDVAMLASSETTLLNGGPRRRAAGSTDELIAQADAARVVVVPATLFESVPRLARTRSRLVLDLSGCAALSRATLRSGHFFLCPNETARSPWLHRLAGAGVARRYQGRGDLRRLIDVVDIDGLADEPDVDARDRLVDPLRLFLTSSARLPRGWAWAPPSPAARAWRVLRTEGVGGVAERAIRRIRRRVGVGTRRLSESAPLAADRRGRHLPPHPTTIEALGRALMLRGSSHRSGRFVDLEIDVSNRCNIRCRMCYFSFDETFHARPVHLRPETFRAIADAVLPHARAVMLSLGSEPLLSPEFPRILELAARYRVPELGFYTNGLLLSERLVDAVLAAGVTLVAISVDGAVKETFESIRRGADFDLLIRNVRMLVRRRGDTGRRQPRVRFGVTMMRSNVEELADIVTLAWRLGVEEMNFFHVVAYDGLGMEHESLIHHQALSDTCLEHALARARDLGIAVVHHPAPFAAARRDRPVESGSAGKEPYCRFPFFHLSIDSLGRIRPCPFAHGEPPVGTIGPDVSVEQIWLGPAMTDLRQRILADDPPPMCRRCSFLASRHPDRVELFSPRPH